MLVIHHKICDVLVKQGNFTEAAKAYRASLVIAERLASGDPSNAQLQRDLSAAQEKVGNVLADQGDMEGALAAFRASLAVAMRLAATDPMNIAFQRDLALSHANVGRILVKQGQADAALQAFSASLATARGEFRSALDHYRRSLAIREQLAASSRRALLCSETFRSLMIASAAPWRSRVKYRPLSPNSRYRWRLQGVWRSPIRPMPLGDATFMHLIGIWVSCRSAVGKARRRGRRIVAPRKSFWPSPCWIPNGGSG